MAQATDSSQIQNSKSETRLPDGQVQNSKFEIKVTDLSKKFNREWIFKKLNYTFQSGKTYAITGPNGSGKSTLMQVVWGQLPQTSGTIAYSSDNKPISQDEVFNRISIATPYMDLIEEFTLLEQLNFHFRMRTLRSGFTIDSLLDKLYLTESKDKIISNFSSGMKQRLKLGLAFYTETSVLFLDEPGSNLDEKAFNWYLENLQQIPKEKLVFIASNQRNEYPTDAEIVDLTKLK